MQWKLAGAGCLAIGLTLGALPGTSTQAEARGGCGPGFHPNPYGICRPNGPRFGFYGPRGYGPPRDRFYGDGPRRRDFY